MAKKTCKNCIFWTHRIFSESTPETEYLGFCSSPNFVYTGDGACIGKEQLGYWDWDEYKAKFHTGSDFGCIHFKKRIKFKNNP